MLGSLLFILQESWLNLRRQGLPVLACVTTSAASLTIFAAFGLLAWHVHGIAQSLPKQFEIHAFLDVKAPRERALELQKQLQATSGVAQVRLVPREAAWPAFKKSYPAPDDLEGLTENPLPDKLEIVTATPEETERIADSIRGMQGVARVQDGRSELRQVLAIASVVRIIGIGIGILLALGTAAIVSNAIRITLFARRREIRVMQLVGATNGFIRLPFLLEGVIEGALGGGLAAAAIVAAAHYLNANVLPSLAFVNEIRFSLDAPVVCGALVAGGAVMGLMGSVFSLRRFLHAI
jgi:cell division transport system permease protein